MSESFVGKIRMFADAFAPRDRVFCNGQLIAISQNTALFSLLGTTYGGDGRTTFALPDLRGRVPLHAGSGPGLSNYPLGQRGGVEQVALSIEQMPSHSHALVATNASANELPPANHTLAVPKENPRLQRQRTQCRDGQNRDRPHRRQPTPRKSPALSHRELHHRPARHFPHP